MLLNAFQFISRSFALVSIISPHNFIVYTNWMLFPFISSPATREKFSTLTDKCFLFMYHMHYYFLLFSYFFTHAIMRSIHTITAIIVFSKNMFLIVSSIKDMLKNNFFISSVKVVVSREHHKNSIVDVLTANVYKKWFIFFTNCLDYNVNLNCYE